MARLPGHEACHTCPTCGLTWCPDCDSAGRACRCLPDDYRDPHGLPAAQIAKLAGMRPAVVTNWRRLLLAELGQPIPCGHSNCGRDAVRIIGDERPDHPEFFGQTHDCCAVHSQEQVDEG